MKIDTISEVQNLLKQLKQINDQAEVLTNNTNQIDVNFGPMTDRDQLNFDGTSELFADDMQRFNDMKDYILSVLEGDAFIITSKLRELGINVTS